MKKRLINAIILLAIICQIGYLIGYGLGSMSYASESSEELIQEQIQKENNQQEELTAQTITVQPGQIRPFFTVRVGGMERKLEGYYSEVEAAWCFAIAEGTENENHNIEIYCDDGQMINMENSLDTMETSFERNGVVYPIKFLKSGVTASLFMDMQDVGKDGLAYLNQDKNNSLAGEATILNESGKVSYKGVLESVSGRGNDSWKADKKGYNLKLKKSADLLGMGANKDFVLLPGYRDNSLLSYKIVQDMAKAMDLPYAPESRFIQVYMDGKYMGMYLLTEKMEIDKNRFDLTNLYKETKMMNGGTLDQFTQNSWKSADSKAQRVWYDIESEPSDITGGYLLELDSKDFSSEQSRFMSNNGTSITLKSNTYASKRQVDYVANYWQDFEDAVSSPDGYNQKGKYYTEYIDITSFANQWLMYELLEDTSMMGSIYFYKDSDLRGDGKLHAAYTWDVEHSFIEEEHLTDSWIMGRMKGDLGEMAPYWMYLYEHGDFKQAVYEQWVSRISPCVQQLLQTEPVEPMNGLNSITEYEYNYIEAATLNSSKWEECNWWDKGERIRLFLTARAGYLNQALVSAAQ